MVWSVIGDDVCLAVKDFFKMGKLLKEINATLIALIPKVEHPSVLGHFRPIALCNVLYKCIMKIIAKRIKGCLGILVDDTKNAFIPGRRISDNILLTQELLKNYHRPIGAPRYVMKVDIKKSYDSVSWDFLIVTKQVEKMIHNFIWGGKSDGRGKAKVAWKDVCVPKQEGGPGIRSLSCWNKALMSYHIWNIVSNKCSLWGKWMHEYRIRKRSFWDIQVAWDSFWSWKSILEVREVIRPFIKSKIGNGKDTSFWFNTWFLEQPLANFCSYREIVELGSNIYAKVADFFRDGSWDCPADLVRRFPGLSNVQIQLTVGRDKVVWVSNSGVPKLFSVSQVCEDLRSRMDIVYWWRLVPEEYSEALLYCVAGFAE
ncbi:uncharacterized protein LOC141673805 [Apium graveolens]|uniref:uncharacterized protein LOC141673805 n=1 Tax=Apium graveolens TaxID=4045 RepID=UPI003D7AD03E